MAMEIIPRKNILIAFSQQQIHNGLRYSKFCDPVRTKKTSVHTRDSYSTVVTICTTYRITKNAAFCPHSVYVFGKIVAINRNFPKQD
jgi:hypothetical protein